ncbi:PulJ/GspJ family protein [Paenibacillus planticolens]|uniref:Prepilin-type N-terminal cleavage/methylation domain-containing protein n=1 Tax=Paenibacillus planticolens TaxID=2654976 RepID=A0ABX1ZG23_9BACL|nr:prepilin-type N-terminal cleavage/methylation domain-containing protein [Paenibacillus planticolens]NOU99041.1 prepilin-type N-terminal cleavage/methylation domain-containing protein [Paenibacillus planticolens]
MRRFVNSIKEQKGYSLIELIAALSIFSLIAGSIYGVINFGFKAYDRVNVENSLRDEGDIIMSAIMSEFYTQAPETVENFSANNETEKGILMKIKLVEKNGEQTVERTVERHVVIDSSDHKVYIYSDQKTTSSAIELKSSVMSGSLIHINNCTNGCTNGLIDVTLELSQTSKGRDHKLTLQSKFGF